VFCGLDVGKAEHHACAVDSTGQRVHDKPLPNDEAALRTVLTGLGQHGRVLMVVDQPASIGALAVAVARDLDIAVAMRRIADLHPGQAKTDARDAHVIAEAARTMPHTLRRLGTNDETLAELSVLAGYDDNLAGKSTRLTNRLRDAMLHIHPALERLLGPRLDRGGVLDLLAAAPTPQTLRELGIDGIAQVMRARSPRLARTLPAQILAALDAQTLLVPGTAAFARVIAGVAAQLRDVHAERDDLATELKARLKDHPLGPVLTSMPGLGVRTTIKILTIVGDGRASPPPDTWPPTPASPRSPGAPARRSRARPG
jgi:transposase